MENRCFSFKNRSLSYDSETKRVEVATKHASWRQLDSSNEKMFIEIMGESYEMKFDDAGLSNSKHGFLNYIRSKGMIVSSEEVTDWALPYLELCHHAPFRVTPENRPYAIPVPLFTLVYHDCIVVPWSHIKGDWYIPSTDHPSSLPLSKVI